MGALPSASLDLLAVLWAQTEAVSWLLLLLRSSQLWRDDSDGALLANHVSLCNYPSIYFQDLVLIKSLESELCVLIKLPVGHVGMLSVERRGWNNVQLVFCPAVWRRSGVARRRVAWGFHSHAAMLEDLRQTEIQFSSVSSEEKMTVLWWGYSRFYKSVLLISVIHLNGSDIF